MPRRRHSGLPRLLGLAVPLLFAACDGANNPLAPDTPSDMPAAPTEEALVPADQAVASDLGLATTGQRIVFSSKRNGAYDVYKMDPQGNNVVRLSSFADKDVEFPVWSYDNKRIAMVRPRKDASNVVRSDIYLMNADGSNKHWARSQPSTFPMGFPSWSPDGSRLVLTVLFGGNPYLATLEVSTGNMAFVTTGGKLVQGWMGSYDPTGQSIVYVGPSLNTLERVFPGGSHSVLFQSTKVVSGRKPTFSPDGKKVAFVDAVGANYNYEIFVLTLATLATKRLTYSGALDAQPTWSPDGTKIAFARRSSGGVAQIYTMNSATGGSLTPITHTATEELVPAWSH
jgi:Tol biopolymer transport system component